MKKTLLLIFATLTLCFTAQATVVNIDPSSEGNLRRGIRDKVQAGDTLVLADGEYDESQSVTMNKEGLVIMAAEGAKPVIKAKSYMKHYATTTIIGIKFDGGGTAEHGFYSYENTNKSLTLIDCEIGNYAQYLITAASDAHIDSLTIEGCLLHDCGDAAVYMTNTDKLLDNLPICSYFKMTNSTVYNINGTQYYGAIDIRENKSAYGAGGTEVIVDHVTLYNYKNPQGGFYIYKSPKLTITNTIVANPTEGPAAFYIYGGTVDNSLYFNGSADSRGTYTNCIDNQNPLFVDADNGDFALAKGSPALGAGTDGSNLGDPRWNAPAVEEPKGITYELDGGVLPAPAVPTQEELWASFKTAAGLTTLGTLVEITEAGAGKPHNDPEDPCACRIICAKLLDANVNAVFALPEWAWLKAYIMTVQSGLPEASSSAWRYAIAAFFLQSQHSAYPASADFTEAGKPENWGAAYQAAHEVVLPTEPVEEDYTLPTPVKEGYIFVGWYDNAEGTGEAYTVIPAGWAGTLYAIWKQGTTTALENIAVEGKAVKTIINGQLIIIKNGVQYNALGQVIK